MDDGKLCFIGLSKCQIEWYCMVMVLSCIDIVEVILGDWRDTGAVLERMKI